MLFSQNKKLYNTYGATMHPLAPPPRPGLPTDKHSHRFTGLAEDSDRHQTVRTNPFLQGRRASPSPSPHPSPCHSRELMSNFVKATF